MRVFCFAEEVSRPLGEPGSRSRAGRLALEGGGVALEVLHLAPGAYLSSASLGVGPGGPATVLAVVSGEATLLSGSGGLKALRAGFGAVLAPDETFELGSERGAAAVLFRLDGQLRPPIWVTQEIEVVEYDASWPECFEQVRAFVWPAVVGLAVRIDHVGSTSVPGLAAKPIIDADVVVASPGDVAEAIQRIEALGYEWRGDLGVPGREAFHAPSGVPLARHHLYLVVDENRAHLDHVLLRDLLREDDGARARYGALKRRNAELVAGDMDRYVAAKASLVAELLTRARAERGLPPVEYWDPGPLGDG